MKNLFLFTFIAAISSFAQLKVPSVFSDNMVLQQKIDVPVWGQAAPNEKVTVKFMGQVKETIADAEGFWKIKLSPLNANCNPQKMSIESDGSKILITNVLVKYGISYGNAK